MTEQLNTGTSADEDSAPNDLRSDFPRLRPTTPPPSFGPFVAAMRQLQDLAVSIDAPEEVLVQARAKAEELADLLAPYAAAEGVSIAGRAVELPGRGSLLMLPWTIDAFGPDGVRTHGKFSRYHVGGNGAVHGGVLPLLFDDLFGMTVYAARRPISRTAYLHINYRKVTPIDTVLNAESSVDRVEGRKTFIKARLTEEDGTVLADGEALMVQLLPGQP
ncbi:PaaI family thioesterase [Skermania sp. ID1734]|uniref:PaaI family thioesterase n=1 Tax=Skermania sp. ID1734 TaxID=2597516 RepID=UPI00117D17DE|nr:PaaI family thioesterase [Skermania sp. ID1734]TSD95115.1 PaaI family thioesterase [Skermania sp. ID1734]